MNLYELVKSNIRLNFLAKFGSLILNLLTVPMALNFLNKYEYGVWLTFSAILNWLNLFDIGLGGGLRNNLTIAIAKNDFIEGRKLVSTAYATISLIALTITVIYFFFNSYIDWAATLNINSKVSLEVEKAADIGIVLFLLRFVFQLISMVMISNQHSGRSGLINVSGSALSFIILFIYDYLGVRGTLTDLVVIMMAPVLIVFLVTSLYYFNTAYKNLAPSLSLIDFGAFNSIANLGVKFFFIQIASIIIYTSGNLFISHFIGPEEVTIYNIAYRLFNVFSSAYYMILTPYFSAFAHSYTLKDYSWIKRNIKRLHVVLALFLVGVFFVLLMSKEIIFLWVGSTVDVDFSLNVLLAILVILQLWNAIYTQFLNSVGKIRIQLIASFFEVFFFIPSAYFFMVHFNLGLKGLVLSSIVPLVVGAFWTYFQYYLIINDNAFGWWDL